MLIITQDKRVAAHRHQPQLYFQRLAINIPGQVFSRVADIDQRLLDVSTAGRVNPQSIGIGLVNYIRNEQFVTDQLGHQRNVVGDKQEILIATDQFHPSVA